MGGSNFGSPRLGGQAADLHCCSTLATHQMMMVGNLGAPPVDRLAGVGADGVEKVGGRHRLQSAVDGCQPDGVSAPTQLVVQFLS